MRPLRVTSLALLAIGCGGSEAASSPTGEGRGDAGPRGGTDAADHYGTDAATDTGTDVAVAVCTPVRASDYDQSCVADSDCVVVAQAPRCPIGTWDNCEVGAINRVDYTRYQPALTQAYATVPLGDLVSCPCEGLAFCNNGLCEPGWCGPGRGPANTSLACVDAGGICTPSEEATCSALGPPNSCLFADEICCVR
jgi:hypothetical protein